MAVTSKKIPLVAVCGPTASGKTALGVSLSKAFGGVVISADSMQIYRGIPVATAQPTEEEKCGIRHDLMGFLDPGTEFSVADYCTLAHKAIEKTYQNGFLPILVGGTGLYVDLVINDIDFCDCGSTAVREKLQKELSSVGALGLYERLKAVDPEAAKKIEPNNTRRIIRALEVFEVTGIPFSKQNELSRKRPSRYETLKLVVSFKDRENLYRRINERVDKMFQSGLIDEALRVRSELRENGAGQAIGHKELYPYFDGKCTLEEAAESLKRATRRYAKRQLTWFLRDPSATVLYADACDVSKEAENAVAAWLQSFQFKDIALKSAAKAAEISAKNAAGKTTNVPKKETETAECSKKAAAADDRKFIGGGQQKREVQ